MEASFHISLPCLSVKETKNFYTTHIGASIGRISQSWVDINLYGHQLTFIKVGKFNFNTPNYVFEGSILPSFHFGVILDQKTWNTVYDKLKTTGLEVVNKTTFLQDKVGEHTSFFIKDPNDYMLEFKNFKNTKDTFTA
ncbi:VOC family protein [Winogradskyella aurantia]|jgi:extradiol dioxygenase family protein|uniref:Bleomycin resistance protein n=1 Tax=Winogradskyella aurantia TaxID=1915063 RepID=A0A265UVH8_9FLAO|nr:bleomycin resistance protein [Winogradskyella aurantia]OZV69319.1 bleomycin resistance protein [Winogradskyella aurantia]